MGAVFHDRPLIEHEHAVGQAVGIAVGKIECVLDKVLGGGDVAGPPPAQLLSSSLVTPGLSGASRFGAHEDSARRDINNHAASVDQMDASQPGRAAPSATDFAIPRASDLPACDQYC